MIKYYCIAVCCFFTITVKSQSVATYLQKNSVILGNTMEQGTVLDKDFFNNQIFLIGESHGIKQPQEIDFNFLKLLNQKVGVHTYIAEIDFAKAWYLNKYLKTGNEKCLDTVFVDWIKYDAQWANQDFKEKIRKIRALNKTLSAERKIQFVGIDQIHNPVLAADYFQEVIDKNKFLSEILEFKPLISLLRTRGEDSLIVQESRKLLNVMNNESFPKISSDERYNLTYALINCSKIDSKSRERVIFENFKNRYKDLNWAREKLYGLWGFSHVLQAKANGGKSVSLAYLLSNDQELSLKGKIASIGMLYLDCQMALPTRFMPPALQNKGKHYTVSSDMNYDGPLTKFEFIEDFKKASSPKSATLFKMNGANSPFLKQQVRIIYSPMMPVQQRLQLDEAQKSLTDYFQYVILVRNSPAVTTILP